MLDLNAIEQAALKVSAKLAERREKCGVGVAPDTVAAFNMSIAGRVLDDEIHGAKAELSRQLDHTTALALIAQLKAQADRIEALEAGLLKADAICEHAEENATEPAELVQIKAVRLATAELLQKGGGDG